MQGFQWDYSAGAHPRHPCDRTGGRVRNNLTYSLYWRKCWRSCSLGGLVIIRRSTMDGCRATTFYGLLEAVELRDHSHIPGGCSTELYAEANDLRLHEVYAIRIGTMYSKYCIA